MNTRYTLARKLASLAIAATLSTVALGSASADTSAKLTRSITVRYGDLNLSNPEGVKKLYKRIRLAADRVCSDSGSIAFPSSISEKCRRDAVEAAIRKVNNKTLTAMHEQRKSGLGLG